MGPGIWQLLIVLAIVVLLFGGRRLASIGSDLGASVRGFKNAVGDASEAPDGDGPGDRR